MTDHPDGSYPDEPRVTLPPTLLADLEDWGVQLHTRSFTRASVDLLLRDLRRTVTSALGYTLLLVSSPGLPEVSITVADRRVAASEVGSSLTFDLPTAYDLSATAAFYARDAGAFDPLAALLADSAAFGGGRIVLAGPLDGDVEPGVHGLDDHTKVNYALGVLLARGLSFEAAQEHLHGLAERRGSLEAAAKHLLSTFTA